MVRKSKKKETAKTANLKYGAIGRAEGEKTEKKKISFKREIKSGKASKVKGKGKNPRVIGYSGGKKRQSNPGDGRRAREGWAQNPKPPDRKRHRYRIAGKPRPSTAGREGKS